jgi:hypothetical protein
VELRTLPFLVTSENEKIQQTNNYQKHHAKSILGTLRVVNLRFSDTDAYRTFPDSMDRKLEQKAEMAETGQLLFRDPLHHDPHAGLRRIPLQALVPVAAGVLRFDPERAGGHSHDRRLPHLRDPLEDHPPGFIGLRKHQEDEDLAGDAMS